jgi:hypothetical protein
MTKTLRRAAAAAAAALAVGACTNDFLTGSAETRTDPNRPTAATARQRFVGIQTNITALLGSDPLRLAGLFTQQLTGAAAYESIVSQYSLSESTTNGFFTTIYGGGGLIDIRALQDQARAVGDSTLLGISQVQEALLIGTAADIFGDVVYSQAYSGPNPTLDPQLQVYDALQGVLDNAITNLSRTGATNTGPGTADRVFNGDRARWTRVARTLKARYFLHTAEVRPPAYALARAQAALGITEAAGNYAVPFSGSINEENLNYQFNVVARPGQIAPGAFFFNLLQQRNDPRLTRYFTNATTLGSQFTTATAPQVFVSAQENLLILAETAYRGGDQAAALAALQQAQQLSDVPQAPATLSGPALLREILTEKYIALFPGLEPWNDYKRTCFPNIAPTATNGRKIPARLFYDANERQTNTNIPAPESQQPRNPNDPANATDPFGNACLGQ